MFVKNMVFNFILKVNPNYFIKYLRKKGIVIGEKTVFYNPLSNVVDTRKPYLIKIGDYCKITDRVVILAHDYGISVPRRVFGPFVGGTGPVNIGNNVFIGVNTTILAGTTIGNNCVVGANSLVKGKFPDNCVIAGNPAKVICSIEDYHNKNVKKVVETAKECARSFYNNSGRFPTIEDMSDGFAVLYLPRTKESVEKYKSFFDLSADDYESVVSDFLSSKPIYDSFEAFMKDTFGDDYHA